MSRTIAKVRAAVAGWIAPAPAAPPAPPEPVGTQTVRRWEAAATSRLNQAHWQNVNSNSINVDLLAHLETLRTRAAYEAFNNPLVQGVITTHAEDIVGARGPSLQVQSDSLAYNNAAEDLWREWFARPTTRGKTSGAALLKLWARDLWTSGEYLAQQVTSKAASGPVKLRLNPLHPRRLGTPPQFAGDKNIVMGVRLSEEGNPQQYYISNPQRYGAHELSTGKYLPIPADMICHGFILQEDDQVRGVPWLASSLTAIADLRDYDTQVLDAARQAADQSIHWYTDHPEAPYLEVNESVEIERRMQSTGPPGWKPFQLVPQQPSTQYVDYRRERHAEIGRPVGMPLMMIRLDASRHNYSSVRFDGQVYVRCVQGLQAWLADGDLRDLAHEVFREGELALALPLRPQRLRLEWTWDVPPHVDPKKEAEAERIKIENGTLPYPDALAAYGTDEDTVIAKRKRTNEKLVAAGLPLLPVAKTSPGAPQDGEPDPPDVEGVVREILEEEEETSDA